MLGTLERSVLVDQGLFLKRLSDNELEFLDVKWFLYEIVGTELKCLTCRLDRRECRHQHDADVRRGLPDGAQHLDAVHIGHLHVRYDHVGRLFFDGCQRLTAVHSRAYRVAALFKNECQQLAITLLVINDQYVCH